jgi:hypothetical protein
VVVLARRRRRAGLVWLGLRARTVWPALCYALFGGLFVLAAGYPGRLRTLLTGLWFTDWYRIIRVATLMMVGIAPRRKCCRKCWTSTTGIRVPPETPIVSQVSGNNGAAQFDPS